MGNKQQLQLNNETLGSILSNVLGLPSQESLKHGAYVWKKHQYTPKVEVTNPSVIADFVQAGERINIKNSNFDLTEIQDFDFWIGMTGKISNSDVSFGNDETYGNYVHIGPSSYSIYSVSVTSPTTAIIDLESLSVNASDITLSYGGTKVLKEAVIGDFVDFVVSDSPTAYPDGGEQDGYWYEKVVEGVGLTGTFGCTKMAVDKLTFTTATSASKVVNHSLNEVPKVAIVLSNNSLDGSTNRVILSAGFNLYGFTTITAATIKTDSSSSNYIGSFTSNFTNTNWNTTQINLTGSNYESGIEYTLITMA